MFCTTVNHYTMVVYNIGKNLRGSPSFCKLYKKSQRLLIKDNSRNVLVTCKQRGILNENTYRYWIYLEETTRVCKRVEYILHANMLKWKLPFVIKQFLEWNMKCSNFLYLNCLGDLQHIWIIRGLCKRECYLPRITLMGIHRRYKASSHSPINFSC